MRFVTFCFAVILLLSGLAAQAHDPAQWRETMEQFEKADAASVMPRNSIVFTGSSSITFWKTLQEQFAPLPVINRGFGGSSIPEAIFWLDTLVLKHRPRAVVLYSGDNDIGEYRDTPEQVLANFKEFVARVHAALPATRVYFLSIKPSILRSANWPEMSRANQLIRAYCESHPGAHFIDVASPMLDESGRPNRDLFKEDGLHMDAKGYELWVSIIKPVLLQQEQ